MRIYDDFFLNETILIIFYIIVFFFNFLINFISWISRKVIKI